MSRDADTLLAAMLSAYRPDQPQPFTLEPGDHVGIAEIQKALHAAALTRQWLKGNATARASFSVFWRNHPSNQAPVEGGE